MKKKPALNLIEVCISMALLAIILSTMADVFSNGYRQSKKYRDEAAAWNLARLVMENNLTEWPSNATSTLNITRGLDNVTYVTQFNQTTVSGFDTDDLRQFNVTVSWDNGARWINLTTYKARD